jgi:UDP-N-acetylglucosamine diphosphorylase / glucose-1-phosphate thymidylyltransferase / UDP-N-acetylgalactosamine diphosphorylase / glucosamine-1-phosphate N-acetyltransferase / galactosamine-1-phosphate N-acetyltransferase
MDRSKTDVVILCAGLGRRLAPLTGSTPKVLIPVKGESLLAHHLRPLATLGFQHVILVVGYLSDAIREYVHAQSNFGLKISFCEQGESRGTGDAVRCALSMVLSDPFVVIYGDVYVPTLADLLTELVSSNEPKIVGARVDDASEFGRIVTQSKHGREYLHRVIEKDGRHSPGLVNAGIYLLPRSIGQSLNRVAMSERGEIELPEALEIEAYSGPRFRVVVIDQWVDVGNPERLSYAEQLGG